MSECIAQAARKSESMSSCIFPQLIACCSISSNLIRCPDCDDDMVGTHVVPRFRFFFQLEDEEGDVLQVGVDKHVSGFTVSCKLSSCSCMTVQAS